MEKIFFFHAYPGGTRLEISQGDIALEKSDAIVNAGNSQLMHGCGVAAAIARSGGKVIEEESAEWVRMNSPDSHSQPAYTRGGVLACKHVIHAVGPIWGKGDEENKLSQAICRSLDLAIQLGCRSFAFPAISTDNFGFPLQTATEVFWQTFREYFFDANPSPLQLVCLVLFDQASAAKFQEIFQRNLDNMQ